MNARPKRKSLNQLNSEVDAFNKMCPIGTQVNLKKDDGSIIGTKTRSEARVLGGHSAVVMLEGVSGGYSIDRVTKL